MSTKTHRFYAPSLIKAFQVFPFGSRSFPIHKKNLSKTFHNLFSSKREEQECSSDCCNFMNQANHLRLVLKSLSLLKNSQRCGTQTHHTHRRCRREMDPYHLQGFCDQEIALRANKDFQHIFVVTGHQLRTQTHFHLNRFHLPVDISACIFASVS